MRVIYPTCPDLLTKATKFEGDALRIDRKGSTKRTIAFPELTNLIKYAAIELDNLNVDNGDEVLILGNNSLPWAAVFFAANSVLGAVPVPLNTGFRKEIRHIGNSLGGASLAVYEEGAISSTQVSYLDDVASRVVTLQDLIPIEEFTSSDGAVHLDPEVNSLSEVTFNREVNPEDTAVILFTSGTMGKPKGVPLTHRNLTSNIVGTENAFGLSEDDCLLSIAPWDHVMGLNLNLVLSCQVGLTFVYSDKYKQIPDLIAQHEATIFLGVPKLFESMVDRFESLRRDVFSWKSIGKETRRYFARQEGMEVLGNLSDLGRRIAEELKGKLFGLASRLNSGFAGRLMMRRLGPQFKYFATGSAPIPPRVLSELRSMGLDMVVGYGVTENAPLISTAGRDETNLESVGTPLHNVAVEIEDPDENGVGEVLISGPSLFDGYKDLPELTERKFVGEWYRTGDMGKFEEGRGDQRVLTLVGRKGNIIVPSTGDTVYAEEVEQALRGMRKVSWIEEYYVREGHKEDRVVVELVVEIDEKQLRAKFVPELTSSADSGRSIDSSDVTVEELFDKERIRNSLRGVVSNEVEAARENIASSKLPKKKIFVKKDGIRRTPTLDVKRNQEFSPDEILYSF